MSFTHERYVIHVTKKCNMACHYCYEKDKDSVYTWDELKNLIDNIVKFSTQKVFGIEYLGGEPCLALDLMIKVFEYFESIKNVEVNNYAITTNGTIVNDKLIEFMKRSTKITWAASMDGNQFMNQLRVMRDTGINSHDLVLKNYKKLQEAGLDNRLGIHMVTHPFNIGYLSKGILHLYENGIRNIGVGTVESTIVIGKEYCDRYIKELDIISKMICDGKLPGLCVHELESMKPRSDKRTYMKDSSGKTIVESYGRSGDDITSKDAYNVLVGQSPLGSLIEDIREIVYTNHQERLRSIGKPGFYNG